MLLCEADRVSIEVAQTLLMMGSHSSFQSERHIASCVIPYIIFFYPADGHSGRNGSGVLRRNEAAVLSRFCFVEARSHQR